MVGTLPALTEIEIIETQSSGYRWSSAIKIKSLDNNIEGYISNNSSMVCTVSYNGNRIYDALKVKEIMDKRRSAAKD